ncbi:Hypothetical predicted protein, partial [Pelobates cultripes]
SDNLQIRGQPKDQISLQISLQIRSGTAMGTACAPSYANLYLGWWEENILPAITKDQYDTCIYSWHRYIDDILVFWLGSVDKFQKLVRDLNNNTIGLQLTHVIDSEHLVFLDLNITVLEDGKVETELFRKDTATNSLLNWTSYHPVKLKSGIPFGQYLRARRNCSTETSFQREANKLRTMFKQKGYPNRILKRAYQRALLINRSESLRSSRPKSETKITRCVGTYDLYWDKVQKIMTHNWPILQHDIDLADNIGNFPQIT